MFFSILSKFSKDQQFQAFGFTTQFDKQVNFCFPLTFNQFNPNVNGVQGVLDVCKNFVQKVELKYPSNFEEIIRTAAKTDIQNWQSFSLHISDGGVDDMKQTINDIVDASDAPLSIIIIVGVGNWSFKDFETFDADDEDLFASSERRMKRDIVQFISFKNTKCASGLKLSY